MTNYLRQFIANLAILSGTINFSLVMATKIKCADVGYNLRVPMI